MKTSFTILIMLFALSINAFVPDEKESDASFKLTDEAKSNIKLEKGSRLYLSQLAFSKDNKADKSVQGNIVVTFSCTSKRKEDFSKCSLIELKNR